jgi:hypothetical protein
MEDFISFGNRIGFFKLPRNMHLHFLEGEVNQIRERYGQLKSTFLWHICMNGTRTSYFGPIYSKSKVEVGIAEHRQYSVHKGRLDGDMFPAAFRVDFDVMKR